MTRVTCRLTAKNWDQLRNPTLGSRVWATFFTYALWGNGTACDRSLIVGRFDDLSLGSWNCAIMREHNFVRNMAIFRTTRQIPHNQTSFV